MNSVTVIWSAMAGACLMLALMHFVIWCRDRAATANLWFFVAVLGVLGLAVGEMATMNAPTVEVYGLGLRFAHLVYLFCTVGIAGFVHSHFGTGRRWLMLLAVGLRVGAVVANFTTGRSLHVAEIHSLRKIEFLGENVTVLDQWEPNRWVLLGQAASLVLVIYVLDAARRLWRKGDREEKRRAVALGGSLALFIVAAAVQSGLVAGGVLKMPFLVSLPFAGMVLAMGYELSRDVLRAARLSRALAESKEVVRQAAERFRRVIEAAPNAMVMADDAGRIVLVNSQAEKVFGYGRAELLGKPIDTLVPEIFPPSTQEIDPVETCGRRRDGMEVVVEIGLTPIEMPEGRFTLASIIDITGRKKAELESARQEKELAHLSRLSILGELAGAIAHELNQPLAAILGNAQVGSAAMRSGPPDLVETAAILDDIADDAKRAGGIIHGMRAMFKKEPVVEFQSLDMNDKVHKVLNLLHSEIVSRKVNVDLDLDPLLPLARASRVEIQQVLINLVLNALDAMRASPAARSLEISTRSSGARVTVSVRDSGSGIAEEIAGRLFEPFVSTKSGGLGLGLAISRSIARRFGGELHGENHPAGGAVFQLGLPIDGERSC